MLDAGICKEKKMDMPEQTQTKSNRVGTSAATTQHQNRHKRGQRERYARDSLSLCSFLGFLEEFLTWLWLRPLPPLQPVPNCCWSHEGGEQHQVRPSQASTIRCHKRGKVCPFFCRQLQALHKQKAYHTGLCTRTRDVTVKGQTNHFNSVSGYILC